MKQLSDIFQIALSQHGLTLALCCVVLALLLMQGGKLVRRIFEVVRLILLKRNRANLWRCLWLSGGLWLFNQPIHDGLQYVEQMYLNPVYLPDTTGGAIEAAYKRELYRNTTPEEYRHVVEQTAVHAAKYGTTPLSIYRVALSECALNPFAFNIRRTTGDTLAAGWIQFTPNGLIGLTHDGAAATMAMAKRMCRRRDIFGLMSLTDQYFSTRLKGRTMPAAIDVYMCVFAPAFVGSSRNAVLYSGYRNPDYFLNKVFDGYRLIDGKVVRMDRWRDGRITLGEVELHLIAKEQEFLKTGNYVSQ
jgi:hypothetical protein